MDRHDAWNWRDWAACRGADLEIFFPVGSTGPALQEIEQAKVICARCPVVDDCLDFATRTGQDFGVWGGLTADERRARRRVRLRAYRTGATASAGAQRIRGQQVGGREVILSRSAPTPAGSGSR